MYGSHDMKHPGFPQVDGGQRDPREMGRHNVDIIYLEFKGLNHFEMHLSS